MIGDENALDVEFESLGCLAIPEVERRDRRNVEKARVFELALDPVVAPGQRIIEVVSDMLVESAVLVRADVVARTYPERRGGVEEVRSPSRAAPRTLSS